MPAKKKPIEAKRGADTTTPKFPYTTKPTTLRKFLQEVPNRPKPLKINESLLKAWGFKDSNDISIIRVLKAVGMVASNNEPTELYGRFMDLKQGATALGPPIKTLYAPMFEAHHLPHNQSPEVLKSLFNIHSGGSESVIGLQIQTFKSLCENASFEKHVAIEPSSDMSVGNENNAGADNKSSDRNGPVIHINLHIHLPENKTRRDYEAMIEDIGRYIYLRQPKGTNDE